MIQPNSNGLRMPLKLKPVETMPKARPAAPGGAALRTSMSRDGAMTPPRKPAAPIAAVSTTDGSVVVGKAAANAPGKTAADIPWLKLAVVSGRGFGLLSDATTVQRINTQGGVHAGACEKAGTFHSAPYAADYVFLKKGS